MRKLFFGALAAASLAAAATPACARDHEDYRRGELGERRHEDRRPAVPQAAPQARPEGERQDFGRGDWGRRDAGRDDHRDGGRSWDRDGDRPVAPPRREEHREVRGDDRHREEWAERARAEEWRERERREREWHEREWRERAYRNRVYAAPPRYIAPPRYRQERIVYGSWFGDGYTRIITSYYGRPCWSYAGWRGPWRRPYEIGYVLPPSLVWGALPGDLYGQLPPAPYGYRYVVVGWDLLLIEEATGLVVDAILLDDR